jgi:hypothetical protein
MVKADELRKNSIGPNIACIACNKIATCACTPGIISGGVPSSRVNNRGEGCSMSTKDRRKLRMSLLTGGFALALGALGSPALALPTLTGLGFDLSAQGIPFSLSEMNLNTKLRQFQSTSSSTTPGTVGSATADHLIKPAPDSSMALANGDSLILNQPIDIAGSHVATGLILLDPTGAVIVTLNRDGANGAQPSISGAPEPGTLALMGLGVGMLFVAVRLRSSVRHK